jgi:transmembrane sensor
MSESPIEEHIEAAQREVGDNAWGAERVETSFRELLVRRQREHHHEAWGPTRVEAAFHELLVRHQKDAALYRRAASISGVAIALAAALALGFLGLRSIAPGAAPVAKGAETGAAVAERLALGDETEVHFDQGTSLDVRERTDARVVVAVQAGTARFRVKHDPRRLFRVEAGEVEVEDIGTTFAVEKAGANVRVSVTEGSVAVSFPEGGGTARRKATLRAGESGTYPLHASRASTADMTNAPSEAVAPGVSGQTPAPGAEAASNWRELARAGEHRRAYDLLSPGGFRDVRDEPGDLLLASDVARLSRHPAESITQLRRLLSRHPRDPRAPSAAFTLGWLLMNELGRPREAATAFAKAESLAPRGNLAEDAVARSVEAWYRAGELVRARTEVERYRKLYPQGRHLGMLQRLVGTP